MRRLSLALLSLGVLALPISSLAAAPGSVTGIDTEVLADRTIRITWSPVQEPDIAAYRIYMSRSSILENQGQYDDFESTEGPVTEYVLSDYDRTLPTIYLAVLAVNAAGEEGPFFVEEAKVVLPPEESSASSLSSEVVPPPEAASSSSAESSEALPPEPPSPPVPEPAATLHLLAATAVSDTQVTLTFSDTPKLDPSTASSIIIRDPMGAALPIEQMTLDGPVLTLQTARQSADVVYEVRVSEPLMSETGLALDSIDRTSFFTGHPTGIAPATGSGAAVTGPDERDVVNFTLSSFPQQDGRFTVSARWEFVGGAPASIVVRQSRDGGRTFGLPEMLPGPMEGVDVPDVSAQEYGLAVYTLDAQGVASRGVFQSIDPATGLVTQGMEQVEQTPPVAAQLLPQPNPPTRTPLSRTGAGTSILLVIAAGAVAGWQKMRKCRQEYSA